MALMKLCGNSPKMAKDVKTETELQFFVGTRCIFCREEVLGDEERALHVARCSSAQKAFRHLLKRIPENKGRVCLNVKWSDELPIPSWPSSHLPQRDLALLDVFKITDEKDISCLLGDIDQDGLLYLLGGINKNHGVRVLDREKKRPSVSICWFGKSSRVLKFRRGNHKSWGRLNSIKNDDQEDDSDGDDSDGDDSDGDAIDDSEGMQLFQISPANYKLDRKRLAMLERLCLMLFYLSLETSGDVARAPFPTDRLLNRRLPLPLLAIDYRTKMSVLKAVSIWLRLVYLAIAEGEIRHT